MFDGIHAIEDAEEEWVAGNALLAEEFGRHASGQAAWADDLDSVLEDVDLDEFTDEIEEWVIDALKGIGCDTARSVLELSVEDLVKRTDLEQETIEEIRNILKSEFE